MDKYVVHVERSDRYNFVKMDLAQKVLKFVPDHICFIL
jgi:hypothetical protein